jgi:hypothetical protein
MVNSFHIIRSRYYHASLMSSARGETTKPGYVRRAPVRADAMTLIRFLFCDFARFRYLSPIG